MTSNKARKRAIRARMDKTGERYTAARRRIVDASTDIDATLPVGPDDVPTDAAPNTDDAASNHLHEPTSPQPPAEPTGSQSSPMMPARVAEPAMSEDAIRRGSGRSWDEWFALLDACDATTRSHAEIARHVEDAWGIDGWWAQTVAVGYERARGMRAPNQRPDGFFVSASKTIQAPAAAIHAAFVDDAQRDRWLEPGTLRLRTQQPARSARFDVLPDAGRLMVTITAKGPAKASVSVQHERLTSAAEVEARRAFWRERLKRLAALAAEIEAQKAD